MMTTNDNSVTASRSEQPEMYSASWYAVQRAAAARRQQEISESRLQQYEGRDSYLSSSDVRIGVQMLVAEAARQDLARIRTLSVAIRRLMQVTQDAGIPLNFNAFSAFEAPFGLPATERRWSLVMRNMTTQTFGVTALPSERLSLELPLQAAAKLALWNKFSSSEFAQSLLQVVRSASRTARSKLNHHIDEPYLSHVANLLNDVCSTLPTVDMRGPSARVRPQTMDFINAPYLAALSVVQRLTQHLSTVDPASFFRKQDVHSPKTTSVQALVVSMGRMIPQSTVSPLVSKTSPLNADDASSSNNLISNTKKCPISTAV